MNKSKSTVLSIIFGCVAYEFLWLLVKTVVINADEYFWVAQKFICILLSLFGTFLFYLILRKD